MQHTSRSFKISALLITLVSILYILSRAGNLSRDLVSEEEVFLMPGRFLLEGKGYFHSWGVLAPVTNAFHKPPLTFLLLGVASFLNSNAVAGAKLVPFLIGFLVCLFPLLATGSVVPSLLILASPFLYAASSHMQTDPTVGLLGCTLLCWGVIKMRAAPGWGAKVLLGSGIVVLWVGKLEIAAMMSAALALAIICEPKKRKLALLKPVVISTVVGIVSLVVITLALANVAHLSVAASLGNTVGTIRYVTGVTLREHAHDYGAASRSTLLYLAAILKVTHLFFLFALPSVIVLVVRRRFLNSARPYAFLLFAAVIPILTYLSLSYTGDGFPRYFLIIFPPLSVLLGFSLSELPRSWRLAVSAVLVTAGVAIMGPQTLAMMRFPGSVSVRANEWGSRAAAELAGAMTKPGDLIMGPGHSLYYLRNRRWLVLDSFDSYPQSYEAADRLQPEIRAAIVPNGVYESRSAKIAGNMKKLGASVFRVGSFDVVVMSGAKTQAQGAVTNLALNQPVRQSSIFAPYGPENGVDGVKSGTGGRKGTFFHTAKEPNPWWDVDLGAQHRLNEVRLFNAEPFQRAASIRVLLSSDGDTWKQVYDNQGRPFGPEPLIVKLEGASARYVRVQLADTIWLHLEEVEVYGL